MKEKDINKIVGERLKELIEATGLTRRKVAEEILEIDESTLSKIIDGSRSLQPHHIYKLKKALNINLNYLFADEKEKKHTPKFLELTTIGKTYLIGRLLKKVREEHNLTKKKLYSMLRTIKSEWQYKKLEDNKEEADETVIYEICSKFNLNLDNVIEEISKEEI